MGTMRTLGRVLLGFLLACLVAGLVQVLFVRTPVELASVASNEFPAAAGSSLELALLAATHSAIFSAAFALIVAGVSEWLALRSIGYSLAAGVAIALLGFFAQYYSEVADQPSIFNNYALQAYLTAGFFGGLVYWMVAGRHAGERRLATAGGGVSSEAQERPARKSVLVEKASGEVKKGSLAERLANKRAALAASAASVMTSVPITKMKTDKAGVEFKPAGGVGEPSPAPVSKPAAPDSRPAMDQPAKKT